jgi:hypothetical protein
MSIQRCILIALPDAEKVGRGVEPAALAAPHLWTSLALVLPPEGPVLARINGRSIFLARRSFVEPEHPLYDADFEWQPLR